MIPLASDLLICSAGQIGREGLLESASPPDRLSSCSCVTILGSSSRRCGWRMLADASVNDTREIAYAEYLHGLTTAWRRGAGKEDVPDAPKVLGTMRRRSTISRPHIGSMPKKFHRHGRRRDERWPAAVVVGHASSCPLWSPISDLTRTSRDFREGPQTDITPAVSKRRNGSPRSPKESPSWGLGLPTSGWNAFTLTLHGTPI